jgi:FkbM family methyltransferase
MKHCVLTYMDTRSSYRVVDFGSRVVGKQTLKHKHLFAAYNVDYIGVDVGPGTNVDVVMQRPYSIPLPDQSADIVISGQVFEHVPFFWASFLEMTRLLKVGGYIFLTAPSRGHLHAHPYDCWRYYPDGYKALAAYANLRLVDVQTDFPPARLPNGRFDYASVPSANYWGDTLGVFQKTEAHDEKAIAGVRNTLTEWANINGDLDETISRFGPLPSKGAKQSVAPSTTEPVVVHKAFNIKFANNPEFLGPKVLKKMHSGRYEIREASAALKYMQEGECVLELGAGLGFISTLIKQRKAPSSYAAIEADPRLIPMINETHRLNGIEGVDLHNCIVTSDPEALNRGFSQFKLAPTFWGSSANRTDLTDSAAALQILTISLSNFLTSLSPTVLIADIEGGEGELFTGIDMPSVNLVILEMHPTIIGNEGVIRVFDELQRMGLAREEYEHNERVGVAVFKRNTSKTALLSDSLASTVPVLMDDGCTGHRGTIEAATTMNDANADSPPQMPWILDGQCLLHVGVFKTGTTSIQGALNAHRADLKKFGILYPGASAAHNNAAMAVLGTRRGWKSGGQVPELTNWDNLVRSTKRNRGKTVISSEAFCQATEEQAITVIDGLGRYRTKVLITLRPLEAILPSTWQEFVKGGLRLPFEEWLRDVLRGPGSRNSTPSFWMRNDFGAQVERWTAAAGAENVTVMVVDPSRRELLHETFEAIVGLPLGFLAPDSSQPSNRSLSANEVEVLRLLNKRMHKQIDFSYHRRLIRAGAIHTLVENRTPGPDEIKLATPPWAVERARELGADAPGRILKSGAHIVGNLATLVPTTIPVATIDAAPANAPVEAAVLLMEGLLRKAVNELAKRDNAVARRTRKPARTRWRLGALLRSPKTSG